MKKFTIIFIFIFLLGFMFMPNAYAAEIPREGVTYFLQYPDGSEDVKETYDEAIAASEEEKLIFTGQTDENGQVVLENIASEGTLRVVQEVPNGYSTDEREVIINLQENKKVEFRNTKGLINPKTGFSILSILLVLGFVIGATILTKKNKKVLLVLPLLLVAGLVNVKADSDDLVIDVKDNLGRGQSGVTVKVYAKPTIDAAPAIKFDANGGHFFDGKILIYAKIPYNGCTENEMWEYFYAQSEEYGGYIDDNTYYAYHDSYYPIYDLFPETISNGYTYRIEWDTNYNGPIYAYDFNGGYLDFHGERVYEISGYPEKGFPSYIRNQMPVKDNYYLIGFDDNSSCTNYNEYGFQTGGPGITYDYMPDKQFACWHDNPDGIYVNDIIFPGNKATCYTQSIYINRSIIFRHSGDYTFYPNLYLEDDDPEFPEESLYSYMDNGYIPITSLKIVDNGQEIVSISSSELELVSNPPPFRDNSYLITNQAKRTVYHNYIEDFVESCNLYIQR